MTVFLSVLSDRDKIGIDAIDSKKSCQVDTD